HTRFSRDWSSDVCSSDLGVDVEVDVVRVQPGAVHGLPGSGDRHVRSGHVAGDRGAGPAVELVLVGVVQAQRDGFAGVDDIGDVRAQSGDANVGGLHEVGPRHSLGQAEASAEFSSAARACATVVMVPSLRSWTMGSLTW